MEPLEEELKKLEIEKTKAETAKIKAETFSRGYKKALDWGPVVASLLSIGGTIFVLWLLNVFEVNSKLSEINKHDFQQDTAQINTSIRIKTQQLNSISHRLDSISHHLDSVSHRNDVIAAQHKRDSVVYKEELDKKINSLTKAEQKAAQDRIDIENEKVVNATNVANASKLAASTYNNTDNQTIWKKAIGKINEMFRPIRRLSFSFPSAANNPAQSLQDFEYQFTDIQVQYYDLREILGLPSVP